MLSIKEGTHPSKRRRGKRGRRQSRNGAEPAAGAVVVAEFRPFKELPLAPELLKAVEDLGFSEATPIQAAAIPIAVSGRDCIGQAQTGSGKTAAFALTALQVIDKEPKGVQALVVTPTRELAVQISEEVKRLARYRKASLLAAVGGHSIDIQIAALRHGVDILIGTPGRLLDLMYRGELDFGAVKLAVIDEADEMLKMGFVDDVEMILSCLPPERQTLLFSATLPKPILRLADSFMRDPVHVAVKNTKETLPDIDQAYVPVDRNDRLGALARTIEAVGEGRVIVFCRTKARVHQAAGYLKGRFPKVGVLEGGMAQSERDRTMRRFRQGSVRILVATDVVARGIDVRNVRCVVNFDCPTDVDSYVHRVGRTARAGASGKAVTLVAPNEKRLLEAIERRVGKLKRLSEPSRSEGVG